MTDTALLLEKTISEVAPLIQRGEISPVDLLEAQLARIATYDGQLRSFITVTAELAHQQAEAAARDVAAGRYRGPLHGIPIGLKDLICTRGIRTTCASPLLADFRPLLDAAVTTRLAEAGAVCVGKLNLTEFALVGYHPTLPYPRNPWHTDYWAGVSSSGSGVATAASLCFAALGSDTGGSIRFPATACGVVGLKPTFGKVSRHGVFPLADTLDHLGPMARSVRDCALLLAVLEGRDERDPATRSDPAVDYLAEIARGIQGLRIGIDRDYCGNGADEAQREAVFRACYILKGLGAEFVEVDLSGLNDACDHWLTLCAVDALLRHREWFPERAGEYGPTFRSLLEHGLTCTAEDYARAQRQRMATSALLANLFTRVDCLLFPATPAPAPLQADMPPDMVVVPEAVPNLVRFTGPTDMSGHPSLTVPNGFTPQGLPTAMQFIGRLGDEATVLRAGAAYEAATAWHTRRPVLHAAES